MAVATHGYAFSHDSTSMLMNRRHLGGTLDWLSVLIREGPTRRGS